MEPAQRIASIFAKSLQAIDEELDGLINGTIKPDKHDKASRIAWLAQKAASVASEQRKAELAELRATNDITPRAMSNWIKRSTKAERDQLRRDLDAADRHQRGGGVFG
jgi:phage terminase Nu1 subunit (DNA packaging protein)